MRVLSDMSIRGESIPRDAIHSAYSELGYAVIENFLDPGQIEQLNNSIQRIIERRKRQGSCEPFAPEQDPYLIEPVFLELLRLPRLISLAKSVLGVEKIFALQSLLYMKAPGTLGRDPHQENFYHRTNPGDSLTTWFSIDSSNPQNGGLYVYEGSHREPVLPIREHRHRMVLESGNNGFRKDRGLPCVIPKGYKKVELNVPPGTLVLIHNQIVHGSGTNRTKNQFRKSHTACYLRAGAPFYSGETARRRLIPVE